MPLDDFPIHEIPAVTETAKLRDRFALAVLQCELAAAPPGESWHPDVIAKRAYAIADAMLATRGTETGGAFAAKLAGASLMKARVVRFLRFKAQQLEDAGKAAGAVKPSLTAALAADFADMIERGEIDAFELDLHFPEVHESAANTKGEGP